MTAALELIDLAKTFDNGVSALGPLGARIGAGEFVSIVGASGCGKSTLLRLIAGLLPATAGRVAWRGMAGQSRRIGFVFQDPTLMPWARLDENIWLPLRLEGMRRSAAQPAIEAARRLVGLDAFGASYPHELSGGMRMRASIARALVTRPDILLLDEPFAALDDITRAQLAADVSRLWREQGWTALFVTHNVTEAVFLSNRVLVMTKRPGRIAAEIPVEFPYPRDRALMLTAEFAAICRRVSEHLSGASAA